MRFLFVGAGARKRALQEQARDRRLSNVLFVDPCPREEVPAHWALSDATVVPLLRDPVFRTTVPSKIFDAMAMGVPILLGVDGEARAIVEEAGAGIAFPPEDADGLVAGIRRLMADEEYRRAISASAVVAAGRHSRDELAARMRSVLCDAAALAVRSG